VVLIVGLGIGKKALIRDLLGSLAEGVLVSLRKGIEMSFVANCKPRFPVAICVVTAVFVAAAPPAVVVTAVGSFSTFCTAGR
jgi:hypothetical protein